MQKFQIAAGMQPDTWGLRVIYMKKIEFIFFKGGKAEGICGGFSKLSSLNYWDMELYQKTGSRNPEKKNMEIFIAGFVGCY